MVVLNGRQCNCGRKGCLEAYASATALTKQTELAIKDNPNGLLAKHAKELGKVNARVAFDVAKMGDKEGQRLVDEYVMYLSEGLLNFCNIFRPDVIVLSGGVANEGDYLVSRVKKYMKEKEFGYKNSPEVEVKVAELGYDSGKIGAASLFFE